MSVAQGSELRSSRRMPGAPELRERDERLDALKTMSGKLSHDFNNFLAPVYGYLTLLKDEISSESTASAYVAAMEAAAQKGEIYISSILLAMRPYRQFSPRDFPLDQVLRDVLARWTSETPMGTDVSVSADIAPFLLYGDEKQWRTVLEQVLSNARYALAMGGQLNVTLQRELLGGEKVQQLGLGTNDVFRLTIRDSGFGMTPDVARRAFDPFFTTRTQIKAAGLGLTIVHSIALFHGGQVELASSEDQGTTVTIWIPAGKPPVVARQSDDRSSRFSAARRAKSVLLIEDDPLMKEVLKNWLSRHDLETETAANEKEARNALRRNGSHCVLVIAEVELKSGRSEDFYATLSELNPAAAWVFLTSRRVPALPHLPGRGEPLVMKKPFSLAAFSEVIRNYTRETSGGGMRPSE